MLKSVLVCVQYVALQTTLQADEVEIYLVKQLDEKLNPSTFANIEILRSSVSECKEKLQVLKEQETLAELKTHSLSYGSMVSTLSKIRLTMTDQQNIVSSFLFYNFFFCYVLFCSFSHIRRSGAPSGSPD